MENDQLSPENSLALIQSMINKAKNTVAGDSFYFLLWGWLVFIASIAQFVLKVILHSPYHYYSWTLMIVGIIVSAYYGYTENKKRRVKTYVEELLNYLWIGVFFSYVLFGFIFARSGWQNCYPFYMGLYAVGSFVSGRALKFSPLVWGSIGSWILAIIATYADYDTNILLCAFAIMLSNIIPGHLMRTRYKNQS